MRYFLSLCCLFACHAARADVLLQELFTEDPIAAGRASVTTGDPARFTYAEGGIKAAYNTALPTARLAWPLSSTLDESQNFTMHVNATLHAEGFFASPNHYAQLAFGLTNSESTGLDRAGGDDGDAFDVMTVDYFPNVSPFFGGPTLGPTVIGSDTGARFFSSIQFPFGMESSLDDEGPLMFDAPLRFELAYAAENEQVTLRVFSGATALPINANQPEIDAGGLDGDVTTIQLPLNAGTAFSFDQFAILLWEDTFLASGAEASVRAAITFSDILVTTPDTAAAGDTDGDGDVDLDDLNQVRNHFGEVGQDAAGDAEPRDGVVDLNDLNLVRNHFGDAPTNVPEPGALLLVNLTSLIVVAAVRIRRR